MCVGERAAEESHEQSLFVLVDHSCCYVGTVWIFLFGARVFNLILLSGKAGKLWSGPAKGHNLAESKIVSPPKDERLSSIIFRI